MQKQQVIQTASTKQSSKTRISPRRELAEQTRLRSSFERRLNRQLLRSFRKTGDLARDEYVSTGQVTITPRKSLQDITDVMISHYRAVIDAFGLRVLRNYKQEAQFELIIKDYINRQVGNRIVGINGTTIKFIRRIIADGEREGLGVAPIGRNIYRQMGGSYSKNRSQTIARTETHNAASFANHQVNASLGIPNQKKRWVATSDDRTRSIHAEMNGVEVGLDEDFIVGGLPMSYAGDPRGGAKNVINCRCVIVYVTDEDEIIQEPQADIVPVSETPQKIDVSDVVSLSNAKRRQAFSDKLNDNLSPLALAAAIKLPKPAIIKNSKRGLYYRKRQEIKSDLEGNTLEHEYGHHVDFAASKKMRFLSQQDRDFQQALIDDAKNLGLAKDGIEFDGMLGFQIASGIRKNLEKLRDEFHEQVEKTKTYSRGRRKGMSIQYTAWEPRYQGANSISDIIDAMSKGSFFTDFKCWGHGRNYYKRTGSFYYEAFANLFAIHGNKKAMADARRIFPNLVREFERMLKEIADG